MVQDIYQIAILPGDGIGPEVVEAAKIVADKAALETGITLSCRDYAFGGAATDQTGAPLPDETLKACLKADGILMGAVGGPKWDGHGRTERPEYGLLSLRKAIKSFANLRPILVHDELADASPLKRTVASGTDILFVRELTGGIYFGEPRGREGAEAFNTLRYSSDEIARIARAGFKWAQRRQGRVVSVDKSNVLEVSVLWREVVSRIHQEEFPDIELSHMYVDNAAMQIVANPRQFDVVLTTNMFGDILSDLASTLVGSLGMLPSACVGGSVGLFEPVHGSAPDIAGTDRANPIAAILSSAMMFDELDEPEMGHKIRGAVRQVLRDGFRTDDIAGHDSYVVGTIEMANEIANRLSGVAV